MLLVKVLVEITAEGFRLNDDDRNYFPLLNIPNVHFAERGVIGPAVCLAERTWIFRIALPWLACVSSLCPDYKVNDGVSSLVLWPVVYAGWPIVNHSSSVTDSLLDNPDGHLLSLQL